MTGVVIDIFVKYLGGRAWIYRRSLIRRCFIRYQCARIEIDPRRLRSQLLM